MKSVRPAIAAVVLALLAVTAYVAWQAWAVRDPAPPVRYTLLDGSHHKLEDLRGRVVLVNFWATSCATCVAEMPEIVALYEKYRHQGFDTLAVAMHYDPPSYVVNFAQTRK